MNRDVYGWVALFSIISMLGLFFAVILWGVNNDYLISELHNVSEQMNDAGTITDEIFTSIDYTASQNAQLADWFDWYWLLSYVIFIGSTVVLSYVTKQETEFGFLGVLFYGTMLLLFVFSVGHTLALWFSNVLTAVIPNITLVLPKFSHWLEWAGLYTFVHLLVCIFANKLNLDIGNAFKKKTDGVNDASGEIL